MSKALLVCFHMYTPFGKQFYEPMLDFFLSQMKKFEDEYDIIYLLDSNWEIDPKKIEGMKATIIRVNPSLRYYDAYKEVLPQIKEDLVLLLDNDMVVYREGPIKSTFGMLQPPGEPYYGRGQKFSVVSIIDQIGEYKTDKLKNGNKFCPYWFATRKDLLMKYLDIEWGDHMPHSETLGLLTEAMLNDGVKVYEWEEDRSSLYFDGSFGYGEDHIEGGKGYYHIRGGSLPAYLLATKKYGEIKTYEDYLKNQPKNEYLRQCAWYTYMDGSHHDALMDMIVNDCEVDLYEWLEYFQKFKEYHGL